MPRNSFAFLKPTWAGYSRKLLPALFAAMFLTAPTGRLCAQAISGTVVGTVHHASGALVADAKDSAKNVATNVVTSTVSGSAGDYHTVLLPPRPLHALPPRTRFP